MKRLTTAETGKKVRQSNFELLRILAMLMIVMHHLVIHGTLDFSGGGTLSTNSVCCCLPRSGNPASTFL